MSQCREKVDLLQQNKSKFITERVQSYSGEWGTQSLVASDMGQQSLFYEVGAISTHQRSASNYLVGSLLRPRGHTVC